MNKSIILVMALLVVILPVSNVAAQEGEARLTVIHASPDAGVVDAFVDGQRTFSDLPYGGGQLQVLTEGQHKVQIAPAGKKADQALTTINVSLKAGRSYTIIAYSDINKKVLALFVEDDLTPPAANQARVRAFQLSADVDSADVALEDRPLLSRASFEEFTEEYVDLDKGKYDLEVRLAGEGEPVVTIPGFQFEAGKIYTIIITGRQADAGKESGLRPIIASAMISPVIESVVPPTATLLPTPTSPPTPTPMPTKTPTPPPTPTSTSTARPAPTNTSTTMPTPSELPLSGGRTASFPLWAVFLTVGTAFIAVGLGLRRLIQTTPPSRFS